ncbi:MAG TPA: YncE family protein [Labilithrix sp.]
MRKITRNMPYATAIAAMAVMLVKLTGCGGGGDDGSAQNPNNPPPPAGDDGGAPPPGALTIAPGPSRGSAIALSADDTILVAVNRDAGSVTVFSVAYPDGASPTLTKKAEVPVGAEPWQVVLSPDGDSAYVVLRKDQKLVKVGGLKSSPAVAGSVAVGSEPTGVALTPGGTKAWVANWVDGTLSGVDTKTMAVTSTIDLNAALVSTQLLGDVKARPALAHPRSIAITNDGDQDESNESVYVTEYYAQRTAAEAADGSNADTAKSGIVYKMKLSDHSLTTIRLAPLADIGFKDSAGGSAGCYPNQLQSITIQDKYAYVSSICASPKGPVGAAGTNLANIKTTTHGVVSVIDLSNDQEKTGATASLHKKFDDVFTMGNVTDDGTRRYPAVPEDIGFVPGAGVSYVVANAADAVFRVRYDFANGSAISELGATNNAFINLSPTGIAANASGQNPIGIATANKDADKRFAFVANDITRNISVLDFNTQAVAGGVAAPVTVATADLPAPGSPEDKVRKGKRFFQTATGRWSLKGQGWNGCQSCHMDGLSDNVTWYFARGPRQSTSLDGTFNKQDPTDQRILNWSAINDEVSDFEGNTRGISGGVGAIVSVNSTPPATTDRIDTTGQAGLAGSADQQSDPANPEGLAAPSVRDDWQTITAYVQSIRSPRRPSNLDGTKVAAGKTLFESDGACVGCHGGAKWTISKKFYAPSTDTMNALLTTAWTQPSGFPSALLPASDQKFMRFQNANAAAFDQIQCVLRPVGTFAIADGVVGAMPELRQDMATPGQGNQPNGNGFNPPSLLGIQVGAPFFHGGGATTLESAFSSTFKAHYTTISPNFLSESDPAARAVTVDNLVQYLLSIDADTANATIPAPGAQGGDFCASP